MKDSDRKEYKASITVFLTLILLALLVLTNCLIEVTKTQNMKSYKRIANESAIHSVFGEYSKILRDTYGVFALDASYMNTSYSEENLLDRFHYYGGSVGATSLDSLQLLTDNNGSAMKEQIIYFMENQYGLDYIENLVGDFGTYEELDLGELESNANVEQGEAQLDELSSLLEQSEEGENLLKDFKGFDLDLIFPLVSKNMEVSTASVELNSLPSGRTLNQGHGSTYQLNYNTVTEKAFIVEYVGKLIPNAVLTEGIGEDMSSIEAGQELLSSSGENSDELKYQQEYILVGKNSDRDNLKSVVHKLLLLRTPINYAYLTTDSIKQGEARVLAASLSVASAGMVPQEAIYQALLWAWSYAESVMEVKSLLSGNKIALVKKGEDWKFSISNILSLGTSDVQVTDQEGGLEYEEYLKILLYLQSSDVLVERVTDMVEHSIQQKYQETTFRVDQCISSVTLDVEVDVGMGVSYQFPIQYRYR